MFRLGLSGLLLLGSAGLAVAVSLLFYTAAYEDRAAQVEWGATTETDASQFITKRYTSHTLALTPMTRVAPASQRHYLFTNNTAQHNAADELSSYRPTGHAVGVGQASPTVVNKPKATIQRSWNTIKQAFR